MSGTEVLYLALAAGGISFLAETMYGLVSFGPAILLTVGWQILYLFGVGSGSIQDSLVNIICMETVACLLQCVVLHKHADLKLVLHNTLPRCAFSVLGMHILMTFDELWLKRAAGALMLLVFAWRFVAHLLSYEKIHVLSQLSGCSMVSLLFLSNSISGITRGIFGIAGPPLMVFLTFFPVDKDIWRGSDAFVKVFTSINQVLYLSFVHEKFTYDNVPVYLSCSIGGLLGVLVGNYFSQYVNPQNFQRFLLLLLFYSGLLLGTSGNEDAQMLIAGFIATSAILFSFYAISRASCPSPTVTGHDILLDEESQGSLDMDALPRLPVSQKSSSLDSSQIVPKFSLSG